MRVFLRSASDPRRSDLARYNWGLNELSSNSGVKIYVPATFVLVLLVLALAAVSPLGFAASSVLLFSARRRALGLRLLTAGLLAGIAIAIVWFAILTWLDGRDATDIRGLAVAFGCGYSVGTLAMSGWLFVRRARFGTTV